MTSLQRSLGFVAALAVAACSKDEGSPSSRKSPRPAPATPTTPTPDPGPVDPSKPAPAETNPAVTGLGTFAIDSIPALAAQTPFELRWGAAEGATAYEVRLATEATCLPPTTDLPATTATSITVPRLPAGGHYACVIAKNAAGVRRASNDGRRFVVPPNAVPTAGVAALAETPVDFEPGKPLVLTVVVSGFTDPDGDEPGLDVQDNNCGMTVKATATPGEFTLTNLTPGFDPCVLRVAVKDVAGRCPDTACTAITTILKARPTGSLRLFAEAGAGSASGVAAAANEFQVMRLWDTDWVLFLGTADGTNYRLWRSDGNPANTGPVDADGPTMTGYAGQLGPNFVVFAGDDGVNGVELWGTNFQADGTVLLKDINAGAGSSNPKNFGWCAGNRVYFQAEDGDGAELWVTTGPTPADTVKVADIYPGAASSNPGEMACYNNQLYFAADTDLGRELWRIAPDSTTPVLVKDIFDGPTGSSPHELRVAGNTLYFVATGADGKQELWASNGAADSTRIVKPTDTTAVGGSEPSGLVAHGDQMYFQAKVTESGVSKTRFLRTNGTANGTVSLNDTASNGSVVVLGTVFDRLVYLAHPAEDTSASPTPLRLFMTNGGAPEPIGSQQFSEPGLGVKLPFFIAARYGPHLYFAAKGPTGDRQLWRTDLTDAGTKPMRDIVTSVLPAAQNAWAPVMTNRGVIFAAESSELGRELFIYDRTVP